MIEEVTTSTYSLTLTSRREAAKRNRRLSRRLTCDVEKLDSEKQASRAKLLKEIYLLKLESLRLDHAAAQCKTRIIRPMSAPRFLSQQKEFGKPKRPLRRPSTTGSQLLSWAGLDCIPENSWHSSPTARAYRKRPKTAHPTISRASQASGNPRQPIIKYSRNGNNRELPPWPKHSSYQSLERRRQNNGYDLTKRRYTII